MITIRYNPRRQELRLDGHANYAPRGQDIICAAVSANLYTLLANLPAKAARTAVWRPGKVRICAAGRRAARTFSMVLRGLQVIADQYPEYVHIQTIE